MANMSSNELRDFIFQAARNGCVDQLRETVHRWGRLPITIQILAQCNEHGDSPLHVAIKSGHHNVVEFLLSWSKNRIKFVGSQRFFQEFYCKEKAEIANNILGFSEKVSVLYIMEYLINPEVDDEILWLKFLLDCVTVSTITRLEKIVALELLGAAFIFENTLTLRYNQNNNDGCFMGIKCWKQSLALRNATSDGEPALPKIPCDLSDAFRNLFGDSVEFMTSDQLEQLEQQLRFRKLPENWQILCGIHGPLVVQALLVIQRIFSETPNVLHLKMWYGYATYCFAFKEYNRSFDVISHLILNQIKRFDPTPSSKCIPTFVLALQRMSNCLIETDKIHLKNPKKDKVKSADLLTLLKFTVHLATLLPVDEVTKDDEKNRTPVYFSLHDAFVLLVDIFPEFNPQEKQQLEDCLSQYVKNKLDKGCCRPIGVVIRLLSSVNRVNKAVIQIIQMLLAVGFNPNATTEGESPLYYLAKCWNKSSSPDSHWTLFLSLLDAGGNLDQTAKDGTTVRSVLKAQKKELMHNDPLLDSLINMSVPLSLCRMCARVIRQQRIPVEGKLPPSLQSFVLCRRI